MSLAVPFRQTGNVATARLKGPTVIGGLMGKHENRMVGTWVLIEIVFAALLLVLGYLAN